MGISGLVGGPAAYSGPLLLSRAGISDAACCRCGYDGRVVRAAKKARMGMGVCGPGGRDRRNRSVEHATPAAESYIAYTRFLGISQPQFEHRQASALPQLLADRFGWPEMAEAVARVYNGLPVDERAKTAIFGSDYGQAGAIDYYGPRLGLPKGSAAM